MIHLFLALEDISESVRLCNGYFEDISSDLFSTILFPQVENLRPCTTRYSHAYTFGFGYGFRRQAYY